MEDQLRKTTISLMGVPIIYRITEKNTKPDIQETSESQLR